MKLLAPAVVLATVLSAQEAQQPRPTFKSAVDLVPVDVTVVDEGTGRPVSGLTAADFVLTVDGKARRIGSVEFISLARHIEEHPAVPLHYSSNAAAVGGRLIALAIDQGNIGAGTGKLAIDAAKRFVAAMNPADRIALYTIPGAGPRIEFTSNHALVSKLLDTVTGAAVHNVGPHSIGIAEVLALQRNDQRTILNLLDRECPGFRSDEEIAACRAQLAGEAQALGAEIRARTNDSLLELRALFERLALVPGPKTVVLISEGLIVEREFSDLRWIAPLASRAHLSLYVLQLEPPQFDASNPRVSATRMADIDIAQQGLGYLAGLARGDVFRVTAGADFAFHRISRELSGSYLLSFEPQPGDRDGRPHKIKITVPGRRNLLVRSRNQFVVEATAAKTTEMLVAETLRSPLLATDVRVKAAVYNFWDPAAQKIRLMIAADIDRSGNRTSKISVAYAILGANGALAASDFVSQLETPISDRSRQAYVAAATVPPGIHTLKLAVVDEAGNRGSVEHTFTAKVESIGQLRIGDPLLAARENDEGPLRTAVDAAFSSGLLHAYMELYSEVRNQMDNVSVVIELAQRPEGPPVESAPLRFHEAAAPGEPRVGEASVTIALLPPGDYVLRAIVSISGRRVGEIVRPLRILQQSK
jgi:VWFA-related protein